MLERFCRHKLVCFIGLILIGSLFSLHGYSQDKDEDHVKSSFILNFIEETSWGTKIDTFHIAIVGNNNISSILKELSNDLSVKGKPFVVYAYPSLQVSKKMELIYLPLKFQYGISGIEGRNILTVTDNGEKANEASIYFSRSNEDKIEYNLNLDKFKKSKLTPSAKLLMYGGYKEEAFGMIEQAEKDLQLQLIKLHDRDQVIKKKEEQIVELANKMKMLERQIFLREKNILRLKNESELNQQSVSSHKSQLDSLRVSYGSEKNLAQQSLLELQKAELRFYKIQDSLIQYQSSLNEKANEIDVNNKILKEQSDKIEEQTQKLSKLDSQLKQSEFYFWGIVGVVFIILVIVFFLFRENKMKHKNLLIIEEQNQKVIEASLHKDEFIANLTHEVRTPLNAITGYTNLLLSKTLDKGNKSYLQKVLLSSNNLLAIINDILDLSKIEAGKIEFEGINFDFHSLIQNTFDSMKIIAESKQLRYTLNFDTNLPEYVNSDPTRINQVLLNLLSNAIKFTDKGSVELNIKLIEINDGKSSILFEIRDSGKGIQEDKLETIFESFTQEDESTSRKYGGTGLGLTISQRIIKLMGGTIEVRSELNKGSEFSFVLELNNADAAGVFYNENNTITIEGIEEKTIVIADDEKMNRELFQEQFFLWNPNVKIDVAKDGKQLVDLVVKNGYDLVLTDIRMPELNGIDATKQILNINPKMKIIGVSANAMDRDVQECLDAGMSDYITKPVNFNELLISIAKQLKLNFNIESGEGEQENNEYFQRMKLLSDSNEEFNDLKQNLIDEVDEILKNADKEISYFDAHSLLNKVIYVNDVELIEKARSLEKSVKADDEPNILIKLQELKQDWGKIKIILLAD